MNYRRILKSNFLQRIARVELLRTTGRKPHRWAVLIVLTAIISLALAGCTEDAVVTPEYQCRQLLDDAVDNATWTTAIQVCGTIVDKNNNITDLGRSLQSQAYMGRAGVTLVDLLAKMGGKNISGLSLMLELFAIDPAVERQRFEDAESAVILLEGLACFKDPDVSCSDTDAFNTMIVSDVVLTSLFVDSLKMKYCTQAKVDAGECDATEVDTVVIPGITDAGVSAITDPQDIAGITTVLNTIYTTTPAYYTTAPLPWVDPAAITSMRRISIYVRANWLGVNELGISSDPALESLLPLAFGADIDNGQCGYAATVNISAPGTAGTDPDAAARMYPRKLDTSTDARLTDNLKYVLVNDTLVVDATKEWGGVFPVPSALVNPDHLDLPSLTCGGSCTNFPTLVSDNDGLTPLNAADVTAAKNELAAVLDQVFPIDNSADPNVDGFTGASGVPCIKGDGWVHHREYDFYLRSFGQ